MNPQATDGVIEEIRSERARQDEKWGEQNHEGPVWAAILGEEYGEACKSLLEVLFPGGPIPEGWHVGDSRVAHLRTELIQVAAVAAGWVEAIDREER